MKVIESFIESKTGDMSDCEDGIVVTSDYVAVIDGYTSKSDFRWEGKTPGVVAKEIIAKTIEGLNSQSTMEEAVDNITEDIFRFYKENNLVDVMARGSAKRISACLILYSKYLNELWVIGDSQALVNGKHYTNEKDIDRIVSEVRSLFINIQLNSGLDEKDLYDKDVGREFIMPILEGQSDLQNSDKYSEYNYILFDGFSFDKDLVKVIKLEEVEEIVLASDGYYELYDTLKETEESLKVVLEEDPLMYKKYKSTKGLAKGNISFDDRAYVRFEV